MEEYRGLTDTELIARLKKYAIPHGPLVGTTRKLYEKKIYEYEKKRTKHPGRSQEAYTEPRSSHSYMQETFVSPRSREDFSYGREALGLKESYDTARNEDYADYGNEDPSPTKSYLGDNYSFPSHEGRYTYKAKDPSPTKSYLSDNYSFPSHEGRYTYKAKDWDLNSSEGPASSYHYEASISSRSNLGGVSSRQPIAEPYLYSSSLEDVPSERDSSSYQTVFHRKSPGPSSLGVEPRRAIRPKLQAPEKDPVSDKGTKHYLPLWPQLLLFMLLAGFLAFAYFFLQGNADDNPFVKYLQH